MDVSPAEGHQISIRHYATKQAAAEQLVDLRWAYPDQYDRSLGWVIALSLLRQGDGLLLSLEVAVTGLQLVIAPASVKLGYSAGNFLFVQDNCVFQSHPVKVRT